MKFKKLVSLLLVVVLGVAILGSCTENDAEKTALNTEALTYVTLRINPEIELIADEAGLVVAANAINEDGEIVLASVELVGMSVEAAGAKFTEAATELGYFTPNGEKDTVYIDVESTVAEESEALEEKLDKSIRDYFNNKGINGKVSPETLDKYADKAAEWGISPGHVKLVMRVLDANPELTDTEVLALSVKDWMQLLKGEEKNIAVGLKADYRAEIEALKLEYSRLFELREEKEMLEAQLEGELTEDEKNTISEKLEKIDAELKPLHKEYKEALSQIKNSFKEASREMRKQYKAEAEKRKNENKAKNSI